MDIKEVRANLNKKVRYTNTNKHLELDGDYIFRACIIRKSEKGVFCQAEIQQGNNSLLITSLNDIQPIENEAICLNE